MMNRRAWDSNSGTCTESIFLDVTRRLANRRSETVMERTREVTPRSDLTFSNHR